MKVDDERDFEAGDLVALRERYVDILLERPSSMLYLGKMSTIDTVKWGLQLSGRPSGGFVHVVMSRGEFDWFHAWHLKRVSS